MIDSLQHVDIVKFIMANISFVRSVIKQDVHFVFLFLSCEGIMSLLFFEKSHCSLTYWTKLLGNPHIFHLSFHRTQQPSKQHFLSGWFGGSISWHFNRSKVQTLTTSTFGGPVASLHGFGGGLGWVFLACPKTGKKNQTALRIRSQQLQGNWRSNKK